MAAKRAGSPNDRRVICRTCLVAEAEFFKLDAILGDSDVSALDCLRYTTRLEDVAMLPNYICNECSAALLVAYNFIKNASEAHEILKQKLCGAEKNSFALKEEVMSCDGSTSTRSGYGGKAVRFRCKICYEKMETKRSLKEHIKFHMDIISYCCQLCEFNCKKRQYLCDHYTLEHKVQPTSEQLKPITQHIESAAQQPEITLSGVGEAYTTVTAIELLPQQYSEQHHSMTRMQIYDLEQQQQQQQQLQQEQQQETEQLVPFIAGDATNDCGKIIVHSLKGDYGGANELNEVGNEFIVAADGTVEQVFNNGIIIKYIDAADNGVLPEPESVVNTTIERDYAQSVTHMEVEDIIVEERDEELLDQTCIEDVLPRTIIQVQQPKKITCKICHQFFPTQAVLKIHMLSHNDIPHFFCDRCTFYTYNKFDLVQHYKDKHDLEATWKQLLPNTQVNRRVEAVRQLYTCDLCLFETHLQPDLSRHYSVKHQMEATDIQLRPATSEPFKRTRASRGRSTNGCNRWSNEVIVTTEVGRHETEPLPSVPVVKFPQPQQQQEQLQQPPPIDENGIFATPLPSDIGGYFAAYDAGGGMAALTTIPLPFDAVPQIVETDETVIPNDITEFDFNGDALFADFDEDDDDGYVANGANHHNDEMHNLPLTSADELEEEGLDDEQCSNSSAADTRPYCAHCNKLFNSQYHFENHMFVHRGLAPYRCELCTNLYNMKRALIRHYKAVHKTTPTRDMIQAKGEKAILNEFAGAEQRSETHKGQVFMCAKCPIESTELANIQLHLRMEHSTVDENFILRKLPYECPKCIRSFVTPARLQRHLERSHIPTRIAKLIDATKPVQRFLENDYESSATGLNAVTEYVEVCMTDGESALTTTTSTDAAANCVQQSANYNDIITTTTITDTITSNSTTITTNHQMTLVTSVSSAQSSLFRCRDCHMTCDTLDELETHRQMHACGTQINMNFLCGFCQRDYKSVELLKHHMKRHVARKYACTQCPKKYISRPELRNHQLIHTGEMPHKCDVCSKQFRYSHHLKRHKDVVHLGKRHRCTECERKFTTLAQLKIHAWTHNGNVPYKCHLCRREFKKRDMLRRHALKAHDIQLTEEQIAEIYRNSMGYTNPHDFTVPVSSGKMLRRCDVEAAEASFQAAEVQCYANTTTLTADKDTFEVD